MAYVVAARWVARDGEEDAVAAAISRLVEPSRNEPGMLQYQAHRDPEDRRVFFIYERYTGADAYQAHLDSEHFAADGFGDAVPRLAARERSVYETIDP
ncbi:MAG: putative quinol monooxygenase [Solirubrobacterales bacterium]